MSHGLENLIEATFALGPLVLGLVGIWIAGKGHWAGPLLGAPALIMGLLLIAALFNNAAGYGILAVLIYAPILIAVGAASFVRWHRRRDR